jgi:hypothetical protein
MYRLDNVNEEEETLLAYKSTHFFELAGGSSMLRVFYDTHFSKVKAKFRILTYPDMQVIFDSKEFKGSFARVMKLSLTEIPSKQLSQ